MSQGKKKRQPRNAFYFFMVDYKKQQEDKGVKFPGGMKDVAEKAAPLWKNMAISDRWQYEEAARVEKQRDKLDLENKFTTQGKSYAQVEREHAEAREREFKMIQEIESTVRLLDKERLSSFPFHIIHLNYFCKQENGMYTPCEIALARFNLQEGIDKTYHTLIDPGDIPLGYKFEASTISKETHQIPVPPDQYGGERDYYKIFTSVKGFVSENKDVRPLYTHDTRIDAVRNVLERLQEDLPETVDFRVYPLTKLFFELRNASASLSFDGAVGFPAFSLAERELDRDVFNFEKGISCDFHEKTDATPHCSLSCVKRWAYLIMDYCCKDLDIKLVAGSHCPEHADTNRQFLPSSENSKDHGTRPAKLQLETGVKHALSSVACRNKEKEDSLTPLRLPKTQPEAIMTMPEEFPCIGAPGGVWAQGQTPVFGRGRTAHLANPITAARGRGLPNLNKDAFAGRGQGILNLENDLEKLKFK
ncbi:hypothetical protein C0J52_05910 [Blattella germanica]|nr:hypothetical protein C0J52_05910 [Blattella germanica]